jgi:hypothetical protein
MLAWVTVVVSIASMLLAGRMARARHRSIKAWVWAAAIVGPFGPMVLYLLGNYAVKASCA